MKFSDDNRYLGVGDGSNLRVFQITYGGQFLAEYTSLSSHQKPIFDMIWLSLNILTVSADKTALLW